MTTPKATAAHPLGEAAGSTSTWQGCTQTPEYWRDVLTATVPYDLTIFETPQSFLDGMADIEAGRVAPMWAVLYLPGWLVDLIWFRRSNSQLTQPAEPAMTQQTTAIESGKESGK